MWTMRYSLGTVAHDDLLSAREAGDLLHVSHETVRRWAEDKRIAHIVLPSGQRRYRRSDIEAILRGVEPSAGVGATEPSEHAS